MEFIITTDLERGLPASIDFNFEDLSRELSERLAAYKGVVVTPDTIRDGKDDRAKLNKLKEAIETRRKEVKKLCLAPYEAFEAKCKQLTGMIDEASGGIDTQIRAFEETEKEQKRAAIHSAYISHIGELEALLPMESIFSPKWLNKTVSLDAAISEMAGIIQKVRNDLRVIRAMNLPCEDQMITAYLVSRDMSAALAEKGKYEARQEQLAKLEEKPAPDVRTVPGHGEVTPEEAEQVSELMKWALNKRSDAAAQPPEEVLKTVKVVFYDTTAAFRAEMKALTQRHGITYGGIKG